MSFEKVNLEWIVKGIQDDAPIQWAEKFAKYLNEGGKDEKLTTSQLRKFFGQLKRIQASGFDPSNKQQLFMLQPQLAYAVGRAKTKNVPNPRIEDFKNQLTNMINKVGEAQGEESKKRFANFISLTEAIVAYHKANGGE
jgi:CRISPR type III-A-associated protein Csm2